MIVGIGPLDQVKRGFQTRQAAVCQYGTGRDTRANEAHKRDGPPKRRRISHSGIRPGVPKN